MIKHLIVLSAMAASLAFAPHADAQVACKADPDASQGVNSVLYDQRSVEHALIAEQAYKAATAALPRAKRDPGDALMPDTPLPAAKRKRPPAVILDVDETVLDNSPAQAFLVTTNASYCDATWDRWVASRAATPVPGAVAFTQAAARAGIKVFYVTNRVCPPSAEPAQPCPAKVDTMAVMARLGFARANDPAAFLLKGEQPDWTSDKSTRRALIARDFRVIMMLGDQLTDFVSPATADKIWNELPLPLVSAAVAALPPGPGAYDRYRAMLNKRWFALPNAEYGFFLNRFKTATDRTSALQPANLGTPATTTP
jgi:5'-nucleotidase (lipoprotein e(P4) family)